MDAVAVGMAGSIAVGYGRELIRLDLSADTCADGMLGMNIKPECAVNSVNSDWNPTPAVARTNSIAVAVIVRINETT